MSKRHLLRIALEDDAVDTPPADPIKAGVGDGAADVFGTQPKPDEPPPADPDPLAVPGETPTDGDTPPADDPNADPNEDPDLPKNDPDKTDPDVPVELPDLKGLEVDRLKELTDKDEMKQLKKTTDTHTVLDAGLTDLQDLTAAIESFRLAIKNRNLVHVDRLSKMAYKVRETRGLDHEPVVALEGHEDRMHVALESFVSTIKNLFKAVLSAIVKAITWIKDRFKEFFSDAYWTASSTQKLCDAVMNNRRDNAAKFRKALATGAIDEKAYVELPSDRMWLTHSDKQPGGGMVIEQYTLMGRQMRKVLPSYEQCFFDLAVLAKLHEPFGSPDLQAFTNAIADVPKAIENQTDYPPGAARFNVNKTIPEFSRPMTHYEGDTCPDGHVLWVREGFLGNVAIKVETLRDQGTPGDARENVQSVANWKMSLVKDNVDQTSGAMRYLFDEEIVAASKASIDLSEELGRQRKTLDILDNQTTMLKELLLRLETGAMKAFEGNSEQQTTAHEFTMLAQAINAVIRNASLILDGGNTYCRKVQYAWMKYLQATLIRDLVLVRTVK